MFYAHQKPVFAELLLDNRNVLRAIVKDNWKYIAILKWISPQARSSLLRAGHDFLNGDESFDFWTEPIREELYNLSEDSKETKNLAETALEKLGKFRTFLAEYLKSCTKTVDAKDPDSLKDLSKEELEKIRSLGYLR